MWVESFKCATKKLNSLLIRYDINLALQKISDGECPKIVRSKENCPTMCTLDYRPVCAAANGEVRTFANECDLRVYNCKQHKGKNCLWYIN